jgi:hypothetical protein
VEQHVELNRFAVAVSFSIVLPGEYQVPA